MATQQIINIGGLPNDQTGDPLRTAFSKINNNFSALFSAESTSIEAYSVGADPGQVIFETPVAVFSQGHFQINTLNPSTNDSQNINITASRTNDGTSVKFTGYGALFTGDPLTSYDMDVSGGNVRVLCNPLTSSLLEHFISYQITYNGVVAVGFDLALDGYPADSVVTDESGLILTTEQ